MIVQENTESCIVRLLEQGGQRRTGTGFFVAPGYILTCAHVVEPELGEPLVEFSVEHSTGSWQAMPEQCRPDGTADLALLRIPSTEHPCVLFSATAEPTDIVWTQGYVVKQGEIRLEPTTGEIEGERRAHLETVSPFILASISSC